MKTRTLKGPDQKYLFFEELIKNLDELAELGAQLASDPTRRVSIGISCYEIRLAISSLKAKANSEAQE